MIISHKNKYVFIKGRKIAGTAIEMALSRKCGDMDVITPISANDEGMRLSWGRGAQNYCKASLYGDEIKCEQVFYNHMPYTDAELKLPVISNYKVWTVERHPYDKVLSQAGYLNTTVDDVINNLDATPLNWPLYCDYAGRCKAVVYKYDCLERVEKDFGIKLPKAKALHRKDYDLTEEQKEKIRSVFEHEFELHGWEA